MSIKPRCFKCSSLHFFYESCIQKGEEPVVLETDMPCPACDAKDEQIKDLKSQVKRFKADSVSATHRREYQRKYMRRYRVNERRVS